MKELFFIFFSVLYIGTIFAQKPLTGFVKDSESNRKLEYCVITSLHSGQTFLTNKDGMFRIPLVSSADTLSFSFVGFVVKYVPVLDLADSSTVSMDLEPFLEFTSDTLNEAHKEILKTATEKLVKGRAFQSRAYMYYETGDLEGNAEMTGICFNAALRGSKLMKINYKNGRTATIEKLLTRVAPNRYNASTPDIWHSVAMMAHSPIQRSARMPSNPLSSYAEKLTDSLWGFKLGNQNTENTLHMKFTSLPSASGNYFDGEVWICNKTASLKQLKLHADNAQTSPFMGAYDVHMDLMYRFSDQEDYPDKLIYTNFNYSYIYHLQDEPNPIKNQFKNKGIVHFYDYNTPYYLDDEKGKGLDLYFYILSTPYDSIFWKYENILPFTQRQQDLLSTIKAKGFQTNYFASDKKENELKILSKKGAIVWHKDSYLSLQPNVLSDTLVSDLSISIYFDINKYADTVLYQTITMLDMDKSKYNLPLNKENLAYQNILFDMAEIIRVNLDEKLRLMNDINAMKNAQMVAQKDLKALISRYNHETKKGQDLDALKVWNDRVLDRTGIDSFKIFDIRYKPKKKKDKKVK